MAELVAFRRQTFLVFLSLFVTSHIPAKTMIKSVSECSRNLVIVWVICWSPAPGSKCTVKVR